MKKIKKMPKIIGTIPLLYNRELIANMCNVMNAHANAIDYLKEVIIEQEKEIEILKSKI